MMRGRLNEADRKVEEEHSTLIGAARRMQDYSDADLEDIYFRLHIMNYPVHYQLVIREMERRGLRPPAEPAPWRIPDLDERLRLWQVWPPVRWAVCAVTALGASCIATFLGLLPIFLFAVPLKFLGIQTTLCYLIMAPIALILGFGVGFRIGGRTVPALAAVAGCASGFYLFWLTRAPEVIYQSIERTQGSGGGIGGL